MMQRNLVLRGVGWLAGVALVLASATACWANGPPDARALFFGQAAEPIELSDHWIGLACNPVREALRAQLGLAENQGLVVEQVLPDSPAAKAGIQRYDVLVKADDKPLGKLQDLIDAVDAAKDNDLTLEMVRGAGPIQIKVKPAERPKSQFPAAGVPGVPDSHWDQMRKYFEQLPRVEQRKLPWRFRFWGPGTILPPRAEEHPPLPGDLSVAITKAGKEPAKVVVKRGDEKWEVTEESLDQLPDDVRPHVERMLRGITPDPGGKAEPHHFDFVPRMPMPQWKGWPQGPMTHPLEQRMEELNRRMEDLRKSIDEMRKNRPHLEDPAPKEDAPEKKEQKV